MFAGVREDAELELSLLCRRQALVWRLRSKGVSHEIVYIRRMARRLRIEVPGGVHHVMARGDERRAVFRDDADRRRYLERLAHYREKFEFEVIAYYNETSA